MRFGLDQDVDAAVAVVLRQHGHEAWTAAGAGLSRAKDDELTVYADDQRAALLTHDVAFSQRRRHNVIGQHVWLRCIDLEAADLIAQRLPEIVKLLERHDHVWIRVSWGGVDLSFSWAGDPRHP
jgi:predicted nuclease of predicted toxin-antitoxin system